MNFIKEGKWAKMNRINELIKEYCPDGVPFKKVKNVYARVEKGLSSNERQEKIYFAENLDDIKRILRLA